MGKHTTSAPLRLDIYQVPSELTELYDALQATSASAIQAIKRGENEIQKQWRLASRLCRQFLSATEEPAQLALTSRYGDWERARLADEPPDDPYTYLLWLAAQAWRLLQCCSDDRVDFSHIDPVRHCAREGIIAVKTASSLQRVLAQRAVQGESKVDDRERGPALKKAGKTAGVRLELV